MQRKLLFTVLIAAGLYLAGSVYIGWQEITGAMASFRWWVFPICLALAFLNYLIRFVKWHYYLHLVDIRLSTAASFQVFLSGFVMTATPGKLGEVFKSCLIKEINQTPVSRSAPIVLAERFTDFLAFLILALLGVTLIPNGTVVFAVSIAIVVLTVVLISWKSAMERMIERSKRLPIIGAKTGHLQAAYESAYRLIALKPLLGATLISMVSWWMECLAFGLVLWGFGYPIPLKEAVFIYAFATILGALMMTPGGIGPTEGTLGGLLIMVSSVPDATAASATILIRICTLWFAVVVGMTALAFSGRSLRHAVIVEEKS